MLRKRALALMGSLVIAGSILMQAAAADTPLSAIDKKHIEALFQALDGELSKDEIAGYRSPSGWGKSFAAMKDEGYFENYDNLGQVISHYKSKSNTSAVSGDDAQVVCPSACVQGIEAWRTEAQSRTFGSAGLSCAANSVVSSSTWITTSPFEIVDLTLNTTAGQCTVARDSVFGSTTETFTETILTYEELLACAPLAQDALISLQVTTATECDISG